MQDVGFAVGAGQQPSADRHHVRLPLHEKHLEPDPGGRREPTDLGHKHRIRQRYGQTPAQYFRSLG
ncbi:hypothetical protein ACFVYV_29010 [Streptomyces mirabilis]|jgi:hypothetical protein|uniref:hypothetical protein n=1 Tax=Streptomyces mirabilis TaxID=68239 RepID=UPI000BB0F328